jgi:hypothetical protein
MEEGELRRPPRSNEARLLIELDAEAAGQDPRNFVRIDSRVVPGVCVAGTGVDYVVNRHTRHTIRATVVTRWLYNNHHHTEYSDYTVRPGADVSVGCVIPGPTMQRFDHAIVSAVFVDG